MISKLLVSDIISVAWASTIISLYYCECYTTLFIITAWFFANSAFTQHKMIEFTESDENDRVRETLCKMRIEEYEKKKAELEKKKSFGEEVMLDPGCVVVGFRLNDGRVCPIHIWNSFSLEEKQAVRDGKSF